MDPVPTASTTREPITPDGSVDDDGGREDGDVELALFRRIRSLSNVSGRLAAGRAALRGPTAYRRYFADPLSLSTPDAQSSNDSSPSNSNQDLPPTPPLTQSSATSLQQPTQSSFDNSSHDSGLEKYIMHGVAWRDAMVQACADLLATSMQQLKKDYNATLAAAPSNTAFPAEARSFEPNPRDLADYVIMTTLKNQDAFAMQNATSWLFNMMDRTGAGYVLRDEFVRYAPFIGPVADAAVAGIVFDELVREQARRASDSDTKEASTDSQKKDSTRVKLRNARDGLRRRSTFQLPSNAATASSSKSNDVSESSRGHSDDVSVSSFDTPQRDLYPPAAALKFDIWRSFFLAIQDKYNCKDDDWSNVKQQLGIDPGEILIKSQGALDHSDVFPTLGKLYLSQRYLIFFAAVGRNHYVARLGAVAELTTGCIPIMMRDVMNVYLESEVKAAIDGVSSSTKQPRKGQNTNEDTKRLEDADQKHDPTLSQQVGKLMRQFTSGRKPLVFSMLEFRETKRRDNWVNLTREMVAAHKLHVELGFGSAGRALTSLVDSSSTGDITKDAEDSSNQDKQNQKKTEVRTLNYVRSPFRNQPSPPLLAVAAHGNIIRYRALRRVTKKNVSTSLLIFSNAEKNTRLISWYTDSVRAYDNWGSRSWIERALATIRENMDTNDRISRVEDDEPFDVARLGNEIGRFAELCSPLARVIQLLMHLFQWRNPPATILAILGCITVAVKGWVHHVPACLVFLQAAWIVETKYNWLGLGMGRAETEDAERRQANVLALVAQVHDTLAAAQNVLSRLNRALGKVESLVLWGAEEWQSWVIVNALCVVGVILLIVPARTLFVSIVFFLFFKYFLPPTNAGMKFWAGVPPRMDYRKRKSGRSSETRKRRISFNKQSTKGSHSNSSDNTGRRERS